MGSFSFKSIKLPVCCGEYCRMAVPNLRQMVCKQIRRVRGKTYSKNLNLQKDLKNIQSEYVLSLGQSQHSRTSILTLVQTEKLNREDKLHLDVF